MKYKAFVEADCIIAFEAKDEEHAEEYLKLVVETGDLGPLNVKSIEENE